MKEKKILIIDDEQDFGFLLKSFFEKKRHSVRVTYTIEEGMKALEEFKPDYIFLDNNLPDGIGWEKMEYILTHYPDSQLNLISAYDVPKTSASNFKILEKPITMKQLEACIH